MTIRQSETGSWISARLGTLLVYATVVTTAVILSTAALACMIDDEDIPSAVAKPARTSVKNKPCGVKFGGPASRMCRAIGKRRSSRRKRSVRRTRRHKGRAKRHAIRLPLPPLPGREPSIGRRNSRPLSKSKSDRRESQIEPNGKQLLSLVNAPDIVQDQLLVLVDKKHGKRTKDRVAKQYGLEPQDAFQVQMLKARAWRFRIPDGRRVQRVVERMRRDPRLAIVQPNFIYRLLGRDNTRVRSAMANFLQAQYAIKKISLTYAHRIAKGVGSKIAVIDTGVDVRHPEFEGAAIRHFDVTNSPRSWHHDGHGTSVTGIISSRFRLIGVAPAAQIFSIRAFRMVGKAVPIATSQALWRAVNLAYRNGARIFNLSFAGRHAEPGLHKLLRRSAQKNIIMVAAGGSKPNTGLAFPAAYPEVIAVTATDHNDAIYMGASRGKHIEFAAPGVSILSPTAKNSYDMPSGTSFAVAHIAGVIALMLEADQALSTDAVRKILASSALDLGASGRDEVFGFGRIDAEKALRITVKRRKQFRIWASLSHSSTVKGD